MGEERRALDQIDPQNGPQRALDLGCWFGPILDQPIGPTEVGFAWSDINPMLYNCSVNNYCIIA